jgi:hypothetical protein
LVGSGSGHLGPDPDPVPDPVLDPGLNKWLCINFLVCLKAINTSGIYVFKLFDPWRYFLEQIFIKKIFRKNLAENLLGSGSGSGTGTGSGTGSGSGRFQKSDPDPVKNRPDPQHWCKLLCDALFFKISLFFLWV